MLKELRIHEFAIIEEMQITLGDGFQVFTGETGAGKSIVLDAIYFISGGRASLDLIRYGAKKAKVEALFEVPSDHPAYSLLSKWGIDYDDEYLIITRDMTTQGRSTCRINGRVITRMMLREIGEMLLDISGQFEHQTLLSTESQLKWLDQAGGKNLLIQRERYSEQYAQYIYQQQLLNEITQNDLEEEQIERLEFERDEINTACLREGEEEELEQKRNQMVYMEKLLQYVHHAYTHLYEEEQGLDQVQKSFSFVQDACTLDKTLLPIQQILQETCYQLEEGARELKRYIDQLVYNPNALSEIEERLNQIHHLKRKYGNSVAKIMQYKEQIEEQLAIQMHAKEQKELLTEQLKETRAKLKDYATSLTAIRQQTALELEKKMKQELSDLHMDTTSFHVAFLSSKEFGSTGCDQIQFQISPNLGEPLRLLAKISSGGELSRIMLALKTIFNQQHAYHTLIFDEIDTGVSGRAAQAIAEKMAALAKRYQILCVTHLPQVASMADQHFYLYKRSSVPSNISKAQQTQQKIETTTQIKALDRVGRISELSRILGGVEVTELTRDHAQEMLDLALCVKQGNKPIQSIP